MLNVYQAYTLETMRQLRYIRLNQLATLMRLRFNSAPDHVERNIRQLRYMNRLEYRDGYLCLPGRQRDNDMLAAVDVMLQLCGTTVPEFTVGVSPCKLVFSLKDTRGYMDFKVIPVKDGNERPILAKTLAQPSEFVCTLLFLLQHKAQIPLLEVDRPAYYVLPNGNNYIFLKKQ